MALWAQYTGDGITTATVPDQSGNGRDLSNIGLVATPSPFDDDTIAISCSGAEFAYNTAIGSQFPASWTFCAKVWRASSATEYAIFSATQNQKFEIFAKHDPYSVFVLKDATGAGGILSVPSLSNETKHVFVISYDSALGVTTLFLDEMTTPADASSIAMIPVVANAQIFLSLAGTENFTGVLGDVRIYDHVLTQPERTAYAGVVAPVVTAEIYQVGTAFYFTLTGSADATTDAVLPVKSLNARLRSGSPSYLQCTLPYTDDIAAAVAARPNGDLQLDFVQHYSDGSETLTTVTTVDLETIQISKGTGSSSIVLTGHRQTTNSTPGSHTISADASVQRGTVSTTVLLPGFNPDILPADSVTVDGVTFTLGSVQLSAAPGRVQTQLVEG